MSTRRSFSSISTSAASSSSSGVTSRLAKLVWRRAWESKGLMRTSRCTPRSAESQPVGEAALDDERRRQQARLLALGGLVDLDPEAAPLGPALVHAQQHLGPVLGVGAAGAGVQLDERVVLVVGPAEQAARLELARAIGDLERTAVDRARRRATSVAVGRARASRANSHEHLGVVEAPAQLVEAVEVRVEAPELGRDRARAGRGRPRGSGRAASSLSSARRARRSSIFR